MSERYICLRDGVKVGGKVLEVGDTFERQPYMGSMVAWVHNGTVRKLDIMDEAPRPAKQEIPLDLKRLNKAELIDLMDGLGYGLDEVEGTGSGGAVTKPDIKRFLESKR